jgi:hypothetical protein
MNIDFYTVTDAFENRTTYIMFIFNCVSHSIILSQLYLRDQQIEAIFYMALRDSDSSLQPSYIT